MTVFLSSQQVLFIHDRLIIETGGEHGLLELRSLESAIARPMATFGGEELYDSLYDKAAALMHSLVFNHPTLDGNKRVAVTAAALFLFRNAIQLVANNQELERFTMWVVDQRPSVDQLSDWFRTNSAPVG